MRVFQRGKIYLGQEKMRMEEDRLKKAVTKERRRLRQSKRYRQRIQKGERKGAREDRKEKGKTTYSHQGIHGIK